MATYIGDKGAKIVHVDQPSVQRCPDADKIIGDPTKPKEPFDKLHMAGGYKICELCDMKPSSVPGSPN